MAHNDNHRYIWNTFHAQRGGAWVRPWLDAAHPRGEHGLLYNLHTGNHAHSPNHPHREQAAAAGQSAIGPSWVVPYPAELAPPSR